MLQNGVKNERKNGTKQVLNYLLVLLFCQGEEDEGRNVYFSDTGD